LDASFGSTYNRSNGQIADGKSEDDESIKINIGGCVGNFLDGIIQFKAGTGLRLKVFKESRTQ
jgi:hypothetical protein